MPMPPPATQAPAPKPSPTLEDRAREGMRDAQILLLNLLEQDGLGEAEQEAAWVLIRWLTERRAGVSA